jgi:hypothetical protein
MLTQQYKLRGPSAGGGAFVTLQTVGPPWVCPSITLLVNPYIPMSVPRLSSVCFNSMARSARRSLATAILAGATLASAVTHNVSTPAQFTTALGAVQPGDIIQLSGTIAGGSFVTTRSGTASLPITIRGDGTARISGSPYALSILHDYYRLENFILQNSNKGLVIDNAEHGIVDNVHVINVTQEAFKLRNQSKYWEFTFCSARTTGTSGTYGEGFYVGQANSNWINGVPDVCEFITFFNCYTLDTVNDGWDIKEGSRNVKMVNCTADFSGPIEPANGASVGSAGFYIRADNIQMIKCRVNALDNNTWAYRLSNQTVNNVDYGSAGNEIKQSSVTGGNVGYVFAEGGTNGTVFTDWTSTSSGSFYATGSGTVTLAAPSVFVERTWSGEGGGTFATLDPTVGASGDPMNNPPPAQTAAPSFSPGGGTYTATQNVTITTSTSGATIRYTTNGTTPSPSNGTIYANPVSIAATTTLKAMAYKSGLTDSAVSSATYTINTGAVAAPIFSPGGGSYASAQSVSMTSATTGATIRYTTNGSTPTQAAGTIYTTPVTVAASMTLKALAYKTGLTDSPVTTASYTISTGTGNSQDIGITSGNDDAKQRASNTVVTNSWRHPLGYDGTEQLEIGLRFPGLNVPRNATVTAAWIQFEADKSNSGTSALSVKAELSANAAAFSTTNGNISSRPLTPASVSWSPANWTQGDRGAAQKTPDLKTLVQAVVNQGTWNSGNAIVFVIDGTGTRTAEAAESGAAKAPVLHVEWQ